MPKMKNVAKNEIVLHDPYSNALWGGGATMSVVQDDGHFQRANTALPADYRKTMKKFVYICGLWVSNS